MSRVVLLSRQTMNTFVSPLDANDNWLIGEWRCIWFVSFENYSFSNKSIIICIKWKDEVKNSIQPCVYSMGVWQGVAMDSLKFYLGLPCPTLLRPANGPPLKRLYGPFWGGPPTGCAACCNLLPFGTPHAVRLWYIVTWRCYPCHSQNNTPWKVTHELNPLGPVWHILGLLLPQWGFASYSLWRVNFIR
jgi:hypothetical protein